MTRLILTTDDSAAGALQNSGVADLVLPILHRFVSGPLPSDVESSAYLARRNRQPRGGQWLDFAPPRNFKAVGGRRQSFRELIERCDSVELWIDNRPDHQLVLIWLLDHLRE